MPPAFKLPLDQSDPAKTEAYDYALDPSLIAPHPVADRACSRLLWLEPSTPQLRMHHGEFGEIVGLLEAGDRLVFNDTKVLPGRLRLHKETGGQVEALVLGLEGVGWEWEGGDFAFGCMTRSSKGLRPGMRLRHQGAEGVAFVVLEASQGVARVRCEGWTGSPQSLLEAFGQTPLPPYILKQRGASSQQPSPDLAAADASRYQTVYAKHPGAVAAPTAGLHFSWEILEALAARGVDFSHVTLHVGPGTFKPVDTEVLIAHPIHRETYIVGAELGAQVAGTRAAGGRVIAVGTTSARVLETEARKSDGFMAGEYDTGLFLYPGQGPILCDGLVTNFHLPRSTLLALVASMVGYEAMRTMYEEAIARRYRFYSYGDATLVWNRTREAHSG